MEHEGTEDHRSHSLGFPTRGAARWVQSQGVHASGPQFPQEEVASSHLMDGCLIPQPQLWVGEKTLAAIVG